MHLTAQHFDAGSIQKLQETEEIVRKVLKNTSSGRSE